MLTRYRCIKIHSWIWFMWQLSGLCYMLFIHYMASNPSLPVIPPVSPICPVTMPHHQTKQGQYKWYNFQQIWESSNIIFPWGNTNTLEIVSCKISLTARMDLKKKKKINAKQHFAWKVNSVWSSLTSLSQFTSSLIDSVVNEFFTDPLTFHQEKNHTSAAEIQPSLGCVYSWQVGWLRMLSSD